MDRYDANMKYEQLKKLAAKGDYASGAQIADQIEWKKIKQWSVMSDAVDCYIGIERYEDARDVLIYAYNKSLGGRRLLVTLAEVYIQLRDFDEATDVYNEFVQKSGRDSIRFPLLYKLRRAQGAPVGELIDILEEYKEIEPDETYEYELARLYSEAGLVDRCVKECDDLVLWFSDGVYVEKALRLKRNYAPLTETQAKLLERLEYITSNGLQYDSEIEFGTASANQSEDTYAENYSSEEYQENAYTKEPYSEEAYSEEIYSKEAYSEEAYAENIYSNDTFEEAYSGEPVEEAFAEDAYEEDAYTEEIAIQADDSILPESDEAVKADYSDIDTETQLEEPGVSEPEPELEESVVGRVEAVKADEAKSEVKESEINKTETKEPEVKEPRKVDITNTTSWETIDIEEMLRADEKETAPAIGVVVPEEELEENDDDIKIRIPDYSLYDTRNLQQELAANMQEILEAGRRMDEREAAKDAEELKASLEESDNDPFATRTYTPVNDSEVSIDSDPTKEIIINKHQWRKSERNRIVYTEATPEDIEAAKQAEEAKQLSASAVIAETVVPKEEAPVDDQIEGQMDILEWLKELEAEEKEAKLKTDSEAVPEIETVPETEAVPEIEVVPEIVMPAEEIPVEIKTQIDIEEEFEEIPEIEDVVPYEDTTPIVEVPATEEVPVSEDVFVSEEISVSEEVSVPEEIAVSEEIEPHREQAAEVNLDLEDAIVAGIERSVDETVSRAQAENELEKENREYKLTDDEKAYLDKYLYINGIDKKLSRFIGARRMDSNVTSTKNNAVVCGGKSVDKMDFAVSLVKAVHCYDESRAKQIARTSAEGLNQKGIKRYAEKLLGKVLIIEGAGNLSKETVRDLCDFMSGDTNGMLVILIDDEYSINRLFVENTAFQAMFSSRFVIKPYSINNLVDIANSYAEENGMKIDERATTELYLLCEELKKLNPRNITEEVWQIVDEAAENARNRVGQKLFGRFSKSLVLKAKDFKSYDDDDDDEE